MVGGGSAGGSVGSSAGGSVGGSAGLSACTARRLLLCRPGRVTALCRPGSPGIVILLLPHPPLALPAPLAPALPCLLLLLQRCLLLRQCLLLLHCLLLRHWLLPEPLPGGGMQCLLCITCPLDVVQVPEDLFLLQPPRVQPHLPPRGVIVAGVAHLLVAHELCLFKGAVLL